MNYEPKGPSLSDKLFGEYRQKKDEMKRSNLENIFDQSFQATLGKMETVKSQMAEKTNIIKEYTPVAQELLNLGKEGDAAAYCNDIGTAQEEIKVLQGELREYQAMSDSFKNARDTVNASGNNFDDGILKGLEALDKYASKLGIEVNSKIRSSYARFRRKKTVGGTVKVKGAYQNAGTYTDYGLKIKEQILAESKAQANAVQGRRTALDSELSSLEQSFTTAQGA